MNKGPWWVSLGAFLWATDGLLRSRLVQSFPSLFIVFFDHLLSLPVTLWLFLKDWKLLQSFHWRHWVSLLVISLGGSVLALWFFTLSFATTSNFTVPILIQKLQPLIAIGLAAVLLKEKLTERYWLWAGIAIIGAYFVSFDATFAFVTMTQADFTPVLYALLAAVLWGASTVAGRYLSTDYPFRFITAARYVMSALFLLLIIGLVGGFNGFELLNAENMRVFLILAFIPGLLALLIYYYGLKTTKASVATIAELTFPLSVIVLNWVFLESPLGSWQIVGAILLVGSIGMLSWKNSKN